jgi:hypothetical protein
MGDISELRGLIIIGTFLAVTMLLIGWMPYDFWVAGEQGRTVNVPDYFEGSALVRFNNTYSIDIDKAVKQDYWGKTQFGHHMYFEARKGELEMWNCHVYDFYGLFYYGNHYQTWRNVDGISRGQILTAEEIDLDRNIQGGISSSDYEVSCGHFKMGASIVYNASTYDNCTSAWNALDLKIGFGIDWDQMGTTYDAWSLITSILFWRPIAGIPLWIMQLISIPIWIASAYIAYILVLRAIGAVFGGGGA